MADPYLYPKLRWPIDARVEKIEDKEVLILACPLGIAEAPLLLVSAVAPILSRFDGILSVQELATQFQLYGVRVELIQELVALLDKHLFLASPRFDAAATSIKAQFQSAKVRPAALAGLSYPATEQELRKLVTSHLSQQNLCAAVPPSPMVGLVSPHIDYRRGGACYGITYQQLTNHDHDLYIVVGTSHQFSNSLFLLTAKDFATPLGILPCDTEFMGKVAAQYGISRSFADEFLHRREHSLELQTPFLRHTKGEKRIAPILVGSFHRILKSQKSPQLHNEYEDFIGALTEATREKIRNSQRVCVIAGVDMAHVGQHFGDEKPLSEPFLQEVERRDRQYLETLIKQDKRALFDHIAEDGDRRRICGFPTMYTVIDLFDRLGVKYNATLFDYRQAVDMTNDCCVTFAGMGLYQAL